YYFHGLLIEGSPSTLLQHVSQILASGAHFQYVDGNVIEVIRPEKDEVIVFADGTVQQPKVEAVEVVDTVTATSTPSLDIGDPTPEPTPEEAAAENEGLPPIEVPVDTPAPEPKPRGRKPKTVTEESTLEAPGLVDAPLVVEEKEAPVPTKVEKSSE